jgi:hypothetical protein
MAVHRAWVVKGHGFRRLLEEQPHPSEGRRRRSRSGGPIAFSPDHLCGGYTVEYGVHLRVRQALACGVRHAGSPSSTMCPFEDQSGVATRAPGIREAAWCEGGHVATGVRAGVGDGDGQVWRHRFADRLLRADFSHAAMTDLALRSGDGGHIISHGPIPPGNCGTRYGDENAFDASLARAPLP